VTLSAYLAFAAAAVTLCRAATSAPDEGETRDAAAPLSCLDLVFVIAAALFILTARLPILELSRDLQPDEAQFSANAIMATSGWLNWDSSDSGSSGPLNVMVQAWPLLFGLDVTFTTMHITGSLLACALAGLTYLGLRTEFGRIYGLLFSLPSVLFLGATTYWDLVHTTSLYLPLTLTSFGILAAVRIWRRPNTLLASIAAFALGMIVITKLQATLLGCYVGGALVVAHVRHEPTWRRRLVKAAPLVFAAILPVVLSVAPLVLSGRVQDFITETVIYSAAYMSHPINPLKWIEAIFSIPLLAPAVSLFGLVILVCGGLWLKGWRQSEPFTWFALGLIGVVAVSMASSGKPHHHYLLFLIPTLPFAAAALTREVLSRKAAWSGLARRGASLLLIVIALIMLPDALIEARRSPAVTNDGALAATGMRFRSPHILQFLLPNAHDSLIVYGYMPYYYVLAGMPSGTRETWGENVILEHARSDRESYRRRFIAEMDQRRPAIIVDTVTFTDHVYRDPVEQGPRAFPALAERLDRDYVRVSLGELEAGCPQTYLRRDRIDHLTATQAEVAFVTASGALSDDAGLYAPSHVIDRNVFESCLDRWLAPAAAPARLDLTLARAERVSRVALLNTRGQWQVPDPERWSYETNVIDNLKSYHAAHHAMVQLMLGDKVIAERQVTVDSYPYWTNVDFGYQTEAIDHVAIQFPDWRGQGPGLNEVVVYRAEQSTAAVGDH
jgi:hypothetical protein